MSDIEIGSVWINKIHEGLTLTVTHNDGKAIKGLLSDGRLYDESPITLLLHYRPETNDEFCDRKNQELKGDMSTIYDQPEPKSQEVKCDTPRAVKILNEAVQIMAERGKSYDKSGGEAERSMPKIVAMFNALTGHELTPEQGWKFMCCLKLARSEQGEYREDNYLDGAAYMALAGEEAEASSE